MSERAGGGFDSGGYAILGMSGTSVAELTKIFDVIERDGELAEILEFPIYAANAREVYQGIKNMEAWPLESTKRSRLGHVGSAGS